MDSAINAMWNGRNSQMLKFKDPMFADEEIVRFELIENRGDRVLVKMLNSGMDIEPTFVYLSADLIEA